MTTQTLETKTKDNEDYQTETDNEFVLKEQNTQKSQSYLDDSKVSTRYYEINFGRKEPKIERKTIESYVLCEKRALARNISAGSEITSGNFKINEISQEEVKAENPGYFHKYDNIIHMVVEGTSRDFSYLEQAVILLGNGKLVQVREVNEDIKLESLVLQNGEKQYSKSSIKDSIKYCLNPSQSVKNYLTIMSVPTTAALAGTLAYLGTSFSDTLNSNFVTCVSTICFGVASGIYASLKLSGEIK